VADVTDMEAPHGRDDQGVPLAPYGLKADGTPRLSNRGRPSGGTAPAPKKKSAGGGGRSSSKRSRTDTVSQLVELSSMLTTPMVGAADSPGVRKKIGERRALGVMGLAVLIDAHAEPAAEAVYVMSQTKPGLLAWMDKVEDKAGLLMLAQVGVSFARAAVQNFMQPSEELAQAARDMVAAKAQRYAAAVQEQYEAAVPQQRTA